MKRASMVTAFALALLTLGGTAWADLAVTVKAAKGVEKHQPVGEATEFAVKDTVWIWTEVTDGDGKKIKHVWKRDGKEEWSVELPVGSKKWVTNSRRTVKAGSYSVEIQGEDGAKLGEVAFTVK
jgi:hypothetical protein